MTDMLTVIAGARDGDERCFTVLYRAVHPGLLRYLRLLVGDDAEDVAADTWLQVARDLRSFRGDEDGFRGWVATIGRHRALDHLRRIRRRPVVTGTLDDLVDRPGDSDSAADALAAVGTAAALAMIARLPRDQAEAVLLRVVMGLDSTTAAKVLGKRAGAVRTAAYRGLGRLRELLRDMPFGPPARGQSGTASGVTPTRAPALKDMR